MRYYSGVQGRGYDKESVRSHGSPVRGWEHAQMAKNRLGWMESVCRQWGLEYEALRCWIILEDEPWICPRLVVLKFEHLSEYSEGTWKYRVSDSVDLGGAWEFTKNVPGVDAVDGLGSTIAYHCPGALGQASLQLSAQWFQLWGMRFVWRKAGHCNDRIASEILNFISQYPEVDDLSEITKLAEREWIFSDFLVQWAPYVFFLGS